MSPVVIISAIVIPILAVLGIYNAIRPSAWSPEATEADADPTPAAVGRSGILQPLTARSVFWAVFGALWAFSLTAGFVFFIIKLLNS